MSEKLNTAIAVIGIDIGKNSFHVVGHNQRGAIAASEVVAWPGMRPRPNDAWRFRVGGRDRAIDRSPIHFRSPGPLSALCSRGFFQGAIMPSVQDQKFGAYPSPEPPSIINQTISKCTIMRHILGMAFGRMIGFSPGCSAIGALMSGPWP
jgi:hypothetical protein